MDWSDLEKHFSVARLGRYRASCNGDDIRAARAYVNNMLLAEATMPVLNVLEIALKAGQNHCRAALWFLEFSIQRPVSGYPMERPAPGFSALSKTKAPTPYYFIRTQPDPRVEKPCFPP